MPPTGEARRTFSLRVLGGGTDLAARVSLDFDQKLFRRNYRRPVLVSAALGAEAGDVERWLGAGAAGLLGYDVAARVLNRVASEAAEPLLLQAVVTGASGEVQSEIRRGAADACLAADCPLVGDPEADRAGGAAVSVTVSATGVVERARMMSPRRLEAGDVVLAVGSERLWPPLVEPMRAALAVMKPGKSGARLSLDPVRALVQPAPSLAGRLQTVLRRYTVKRVVHAMAPVEGDGLAAAIARLTAGRFTVKRARGRRSWSEMASLLAASAGEVEGADEGHVLGIGYLMAVGETFAGAIARRLRRLGAAAYTFGRLAPGGASS